MLFRQIRSNSFKQLVVKGLIDDPVEVVGKDTRLLAVVSDGGVRYKAYRLCCCYDGCTLCKPVVSTSHTVVKVQQDSPSAVKTFLIRRRLGTVG